MNEEIKKTLARKVYDDFREASANRNKYMLFSARKGDCSIADTGEEFVPIKSGKIIIKTAEGTKMLSIKNGELNDSEIELLAAKNEALVKRREEHVLSATQFLYRDCKKSVVTSCIAGHDARVAVRTRLVRRDDLPLERVLEVHELGLVEFKKSHIYIFLC